METQKPYELVNGPILLLLYDKVAETSIYAYLNRVFEQRQKKERHIEHKRKLLIAKI